MHAWVAFADGGVLLHNHTNTHTGFCRTVVPRPPPITLHRHHVAGQRAAVLRVGLFPAGVGHLDRHRVEAASTATSGAVHRSADVSGGLRAQVEAPHNFLATFGAGARVSAGLVVASLRGPMARHFASMKIEGPGLQKPGASRAAGCRQPNRHLCIAHFQRLPRDRFALGGGPGPYPPTCATAEACGQTRHPRRRVCHVGVGAAENRRRAKQRPRRCSRRMGGASPWLVVRRGRGARGKACGDWCARRWRGAPPCRRVRYLRAGGCSTRSASSGRGRRRPWRRRRGRRGCGGGGAPVEADAAAAGLRAARERQGRGARRRGAALADLNSNTGGFELAQEDEDMRMFRASKMRTAAAGAVSGR